MIPVKCVCYYDKYRDTLWPAVLSCRPMVGDHVEPIGGGDFLTIASIRHIWMAGVPGLKLFLTTADGKVPQ